MMTEKKMNLTVLACILGADAWYLYKSFTAPSYKMVFIGPYEVPKIIGIALAILCCIALVQTLGAKNEDGRFSIENPLLVLVTSFATAAFLMLWQSFGKFHIWGAAYLMILLFTYRDSGGRFSKKNILSNIVITAVLILAVYLIFERIMRIRL